MNRILLVALVIGLVACGNDERIKGDVLFAEANYIAAVTAYNEYLDLHPSHVKSIYNRGRANEELKKYDLAQKDFELVLELDKKNTSALLSMAKQYYRKDDFEKSIYFSDQALKLNDQLANAHFWNARAAHQMGEFGDAMASYNSAINLDRSLGEAFLYRGAIKLQANKNKGACADFIAANKLGVKEAKSVISKYCK